MAKLRWTRLLSLALVSVMPLGVLAPGCTSGSTSTVGQKISCTDTGAGVADCHPVEGGTTGSGSGSGSGTCEDVDDDGDRDHDGTVDSADDDDDGDGISNDRDCDKRHGGDDDGVDDRDGSDAGDH
jgi:hypothetical protein